MDSPCAFRPKAGTCWDVDFRSGHAYLRCRESGGRCTRQPGQIRKEAATTNSHRVVRLLLSPFDNDPLYA